MACVGVGQPRESRLGFKENPSMNQGRSGLHSGASGKGPKGEGGEQPRATEWWLVEDGEKTLCRRVTKKQKNHDKNYN
jgi:hypothetical protein